MTPNAKTSPNNTAPQSTLDDIRTAGFSPTLRIIGDVHAQIEETIREKPSYLDLIAPVPFSVQVGDMGDSIAYNILLSQVDSTKHRFVPGNHDDYDNLPPHSLGDFGEAQLGGVRFFFVRGAYSTDKKQRLERQQRLPNKLWWPQEELSDNQMEAAIAAYESLKPVIVISHDCPTSIATFLKPQLSPRELPASVSRTEQMLQRMIEIHQPTLWCFGHHHTDWEYQLDGTTFRCIDELSYLDIKDKFNLQG